MYDKGTCCLCGNEYDNFGNNAQPVKDGRCCDACNWEKVIPARLGCAFEELAWEGFPTGLRVRDDEATEEEKLRVNRAPAKKQDGAS